MDDIENHLIMHISVSQHKRYLAEAKAQVLREVANTLPEHPALQRLLHARADLIELAVIDA